GRISHGFQWLDPARRGEATAYFAPHTGIGRALSRPSPHPRRIGVVGLGAGTLAAYGRPGEVIRFYEINPAVVHVARAHFSFLSDSPADVYVVLGDGRMSLAAEPPQGFDVLALDAFSGDAIPTHLITREAVALYLGHLRPDGVLAVNVSNRHADLTRVVRQHAADFGLAQAFVSARSKSPLGPYTSHWMLLSRDPAVLADPAIATGTRPPPRAERAPVRWTDDHAPVWAVLR
ncbi:MAG: fused MFS/spermidine synthase, partial [Myxococcales bacterium]|nr:fused MFS/spermidine synthase [Myxococcales bacterium]